MKALLRNTAATLALLFATASAESAHAAEPAVRSAAPTTQQQRFETRGPNRALLRSGLWTLGLSYVPAVAVAVESSLAADDKLFIPVAGPFLDYASRDCRDCKNETLNRALLVTDGIFQSLGALQILGSALFYESRVPDASNPKRTVAGPSLRIRPTKIGRAFGVAASGRF